MALGRYAYGRHCKRVRIPGRGTRCHCRRPNGRASFAPSNWCQGRTPSRVSAATRKRKGG